MPRRVFAPRAFETGRATPRTIASERVECFHPPPPSLPRALNGTEAREAGGRKLRRRESCFQDGIFEPRVVAGPSIYIHPRYQSVQIDTARRPVPLNDERPAPAASRFRFIIRPGSPARFPRTRPAGAADFLRAIGAAVTARGSPATTGAENGAWPLALLAFCQLDFTRRPSAFSHLTSFSLFSPVPPPSLSPASSSPRRRRKVSRSSAGSRVLIPRYVNIPPFSPVSRQEFSNALAAERSSKVE